MPFFSSDVSNGVATVERSTNIENGEDDSSSTLTSSTESCNDEEADPASQEGPEVHPSQPVPGPPPVLRPEIAILKLEQKFKDAMTKNADLSSEKERLEHIVVQLQEETDTVGKQREPFYGYICVLFNSPLFSQQDAPCSMLFRGFLNLSIGCLSLNRKLEMTTPRFEI